jgi:multimeric flavodoxin WrbA
MKITILNGNPNEDNTAFDGYLNQLSEELVSDTHEVTILKLRAMDLKYCIGCLDCWVKTPGVCVTDDEGRDVCRAYINSDFVLWASPVIMGFYSALLKKVTDKFVALVNPWAVFVDGESHHMARYENYPVTGLLLEKSSDTDDEDIQIISDTHERTTLNFKSTSAFTKLMLDPVKEVAHEINSI